MSTYFSDKISRTLLLDEDWISRIGFPFAFQMDIQGFITAHDLEGKVAYSKKY